MYSQIENKVTELKAQIKDVAQVNPGEVKNLVEFKTLTPEAQAEAYNESAGLVATNWFEENKTLLMYGVIGFLAWKFLK